MTNSGSISGVTNGGLYNSGTITSLDNGTLGTIGGGHTGIYNVGQFGTLANSGSIGGVTRGIYTSGSIGTLSNSGVISGVTGIYNLGGTIGMLSNSGTISGGLTSAGIVNAGMIGTLNNSGRISSGMTALDVGDAGTLGTLTNSGTIAGGYWGITNGGTIGTLSNSGLISGGSHIGIQNAADRTIGVLTNTGAISGGQYGVYNFGGMIGTLTNSGTISGGNAGILNAINGGATGMIGTLTNSGVISGSSTGIANRGTIGTLTNSGTISNSYSGIANSGSIGTLSNSGTISDLHGIYNSGSIGTLTNSGFISGTYTTASGIQNDGTITVLTNTSTGTISGGKTGVGNSSQGAIGTLTNSGTISGGSYAIFSTGSGLGTLVNTGVISGNINVANQDLTIAGGSGTVYGTLTNGSITVPNGNLYFASGNQLLRDNINVNSGTGTVFNAGNLMLTTHQTITGNFAQGTIGSLIIGASGPSTGGQLTVTGAASMANAQLVFNGLSGFKPANGSTYTLVVANASGTSYVGDKITITIPNYTATLSVQSVGSNSDLVLSFMQLSVAPTIYADTLMTQRGAFLAVSDAVGGQMRAMRGAFGDAGTSSVSGPHDNTVWITGTGQFVHTSGGGGAPGYSSSGGGAVVGIDHAMTPELRLGVALGFGGQSINGGNGMSYDGQAVQMQLYGSAQRGIGFVDAQLGGVLSQGTAKRTVADSPRAEGDVNGGGVGASVRGGVRTSFGGWNVEPSVTLGGMSLSQGALSETGADSADLRIGHGTLNSLYTMPGVEVDRRFALSNGYALVAAARAGWMHEMLDTRSHLTATTQDGAASPFGAAPIGRDAADLALHVELRTPSNLRVFARYETMLDGRSTSQTAAGGVKFTW